MADSQNLIIIILFAIASILHGISGIGVTLVTTTGLASLYPFQTAIIFSLFPSLALNAMTWLIGNGTIRHNFVYYLRNYWLLAVMSLLGSVIGAKLILWMDSAYLQIMLSIVIAFYVIKSLFSSGWFSNVRFASRSGKVPSKKVIKLPATKPVLIATGLIAGIVGGATNAMSSVLMMYLLSMSNDKDTIAKVGNMCYLLGKLAQIFVLYQPIKALSTGEWGLIAVLTLVSMVFLLMGIRLRKYLPQHRFRQLILVILTILGLKVGWQGVMGL